MLVSFISFVLSLIPARYRKPAISGNSHVLFSPSHFLQFECHLLFGFAVLFSSSSCFISPIRVLHFLHYQSYCSLDWVVPVEMYNLSTLPAPIFSIFNSLSRNTTGRKCIISPLSLLLFFSIFNFSLCRTTTSSQRQAHRMCTTESEDSARATI